MPIKDPFNIGCASAIFILSDDLSQPCILAVQSLERRQRINKEMQDCGINYREAYQKLKMEGRLGPPDNWKPLGGMIDFWRSPVLQEEYVRLGILGKEETEEQKQFLKKVGERLLLDDDMLECAAYVTVLSEFSEETGLQAEQVEFLMRRNDRDKSGEWQFYPRFWYLVKKASGELSTTPGDEDISPPEWKPLMRLFPRRKDGFYPFHPGHVPAVKMALGRLVEEGNQNLVPVIEYLERAFPALKPVPQPLAPQLPKGPVTDEEAFRMAMESVRPLKKR